MKFDYDILFEFIPDEDKKYFQVWDNVYLVQKYSSIPNFEKIHNVKNIVATYRAPFEERLLITLNEYELRLKQKERDIKLNKLI